MHVYWRSPCWLVALVLVGLAACGRSADVSNLPAASPSSGVTSLPPSPVPSSSESPTPIAPLGPALTTVTIYVVDAQCDQLVPETVTVSSERSLEAVVGIIVDRQSNADLELVGYRVRHEPGSSQVTIDLRRSPTAKRGFVSLSTCEQLALFGSLHKTVTSHPAWGIKSVTFTEQGKAINL